MLTITSRRRAIHAIVEALTRDYIAHGGIVQQCPTAYAAPVQQIERHRVARIPVQREPELYDTFKL